MVMTITVWLKFGEREKEHRGSYMVAERDSDPQVFEY